MAKVLYVVPQGQDLGGIITSSENLMLGFKEAGHEATFIHLNHGNAQGAPPRGQHADDYVVGPGTGMMMHPLHGWRGSQYTTYRPWEFVEVAEKHDVVIWGAMYGLRNDKTEGHTEWLPVITGHGKPQVFMVRDDHLEKRVPWVMALAKHAKAFAGVQQCSFDSCAGLGVPCGLVFSGHGPVDFPALYGKRVNKALAVATWKPWKQGRKLLHSTLHWKGLGLTLAGDGIELRYMRSPDKFRDRDLLPNGRKIWDAAMEGRVDYLGPIQESHRDELLRTHKFMIDLSRRENTGQINRVVIEAMRFGAVPIADPRFLSGNAEGAGDIFTAGIHYLPVDSSKDAQSVACQVNKIARLPSALLATIRDNGAELADLFSRKQAALDLVALAKGRRGGFKYSKNGRVDEGKLVRGMDAFNEIFGDLP